MIQTLNNFLNCFDRFLRRLAAVAIVMLIVPFLCLMYIFGLFNFTVSQEDDNYE